MPAAGGPAPVGAELSKFCADVLPPSQFAYVVHMVSCGIDKAHTPAPFLNLWWASDLPQPEAEGNVNRAENYEAPLDEIVAIGDAGEGSIARGGMTFYDIAVNSEIPDNLFFAVVRWAG